MKKQNLVRLLLAILLLGFTARMVTSYVVYGPQSMDDYGHAVLPGLEFADGKALEIPVWRSPLLVWTLGGITEIGHALGLVDVFSLIRFQLIFLGLFSFLLPGYYVWTRRDDLVREPRFQLMAVSLLSLHFVMLFASTRAFGESIAMTLSFIALLMMQKALPQRQYGFLFFGSLLLGIASLYRFQIGVFSVGFLAYMIWKKEWKGVGVLILAGLVSAVLQGLVDHQVGRWPLQTLYEYLYVNKDGAVEHSIQPWYNTWITALALMFVPFSLPLFRHWNKLNREEKVLAALCAFFIFMHSLIPHKEERFLYPVMPFLLLILAKLWSMAWNEKSEKWVFRPFAFLVLIIGFFLVPVSNSQSGEYEPMRYAESLHKPTILWENDSLLEHSAFYMKIVRKPVVINFDKAWPKEGIMQDGIKQNEFVFVTSNDTQVETLQKFLDSVAGDPSIVCSAIWKVQSPIDAVIYAMNPHMNVRRRPSWMAHCHVKN